MIIYIIRHKTDLRRIFHSLPHKHCNWVRNVVAHWVLDADPGAVPVATFPDLVRPSRRGKVISDFIAFSDPLS